MSAEHTPGPWMIRKTDRWSRYQITDVLDEDGFARVVSDVQKLEDARLIAAAPELLAALQKIEANAAESVEWIRRAAREAIAKAGVS